MTQRIPHCLKNMKGMMQVVRILAYLDLGGRGSSPQVRCKHQKRQKKTQSASRHRAVDQRKAAIPGASNSAKRILDASFAGSFCKSF